MCEITVESKTRVVEHGHTILYVKEYRGVLEENGRVRLLAYVWKRVPLAGSQLTGPYSSEDRWKDAA